MPKKESDPEKELDRAFELEEHSRWGMAIGAGLFAMGAVDALWGEYDIQKELNRVLPVRATQTQIIAASIERESALIDVYIAKRNNLPSDAADNRLMAVQGFFNDVRYQKEVEAGVRSYDGDLTKPKNRLLGDAVGMALGFAFAVQGAYLRYRAQQKIYSYYNEG